MLSSAVVCRLQKKRKKLALKAADTGGGEGGPDTGTDAASVATTPSQEGGGRGTRAEAANGAIDGKADEGGGADAGKTSDKRSSPTIATLCQQVVSGSVFLCERH